jgi:hypothetical protein
MNGRMGRVIAVTLVLAGGCGGAALDDQGGMTGGAGTAGGLGGSAGGEPAAGGATGDGSAGAGPAGGGSSGSGGMQGAAGASGAPASGGGVGGGLAGVGGAAWLTPPPVPPALVVPAGATVVLHAHAAGAQVYTCTATGGADAGAATYAWVLEAPDAKLYDSTGAQLGTHGAGPSWTSNDGSVAHGVKVGELNAPTPDAISWLLLRVASTSGAGAFSDVTYVQRLNTVGGKAPATGCDATTVGTDTRAGYSADYYFYAGGGAAAWLTPPTVPNAIAVPTEVRLTLHERGLGVQIYACAGSAGGAGGAATYAWVFKAPDALLTDMSFVPVAMHGAGPSWTSSDGSAVVAPEIARVDSPLPDAIPWLLLKELSTSGAGVFSDVAFVQRLNTAGGQAPATGCDAKTVNTIVRVPYSADYFFYVSTEAADGGTGQD